MQDVTFEPTLESAVLLAKKNPDNPALWMRQVRMTFTCSFDAGLAEWLDATGLRDQLVKRAIKSVKIPIDAYHAKAAFESSAGNAEHDVDGVSATAAVKGKDESEHEELTLVLSAFPDAGLLSFLACSLKRGVTVSLKRSQMKLKNVEGRK